MSTHYWNEWGYGSNLMDFRPTIEGFKNVLSSAKETENFVNLVKKNIRDENISKNITIDNFSLDEDGFLTLNGTLLTEVIEPEVISEEYNGSGWFGENLIFDVLAYAISKEIEDITGEVQACICSFNGGSGDGAVMIIPGLPWNYVENQNKLMKESGYSKIVVKYFRMLGYIDGISPWDYCSVEHWG